jgi:hypothetical protein
LASTLFTKRKKARGAKLYRRTHEILLLIVAAMMLAASALTFTARG